MTRNYVFQKFNLADGQVGSRLQVDLESFFEFSFWMSEELERLVDEYRPSHLPPPKVLGPKPPAISALPTSGDN